MRDNRRWLATPIVANGLMYVPEGSGRVVAFDAVSGDVVWIHERRFPDDVAISEGYARTRGVSIYRDTGLLGHGGLLPGRAGCTDGDAALGGEDRRLPHRRGARASAAHRRRQGVPRPRRRRQRRARAVPCVRRRDRRAAVDGQHRARTRAIPATTPGRAATYRRSAARPGTRSATIPSLRLVYFSTGQPAPWSTALRGPGDALYTNTVLAVDAQTGKIRWHFQLNPADDWDRAGYENMLVDLAIGGRHAQGADPDRQDGLGRRPRSRKPASSCTPSRPPTTTSSPDGRRRDVRSSTRR